MVASAASSLFSSKPVPQGLHFQRVGGFGATANGGGFFSFRIGRRGASDMLSGFIAANRCGASPFDRAVLALWRLFGAAAAMRVAYRSIAALNLNG